MRAWRETAKVFQIIPPSARWLATSSAGDAALFGHPDLTCPDDWHKISQAAITKCNALVRDTQACPPGREVVHILDDISDTLCHATDAAAFCGAVHADKTWRSAAHQAQRTLQGYLTELNTTDTLWHALQASMEIAHGRAPSSADESSWTAEEVKVGDSLLHEFRQAGMALEPRVQEQHRMLAANEQELIMALFQFETHRYDGGPVTLGVPRALADAYTLRRANTFLPGTQAAWSVPADMDPVAVAADGPMQRWLASQKHSSAARGVAYSALKSFPVGVQEALVQLARVRHDIAGLVGSPSYMHYRLQGAALTDDPAEVQSFLAGLADSNREAAAAELQQLQRCARDSGLLGPGERLAIWDVALARQQGLEQEVQRAGLPAQDPGFTLEDALSTLFRVADHLFGVTFEQVLCGRREAWAPGVQKFRAVCRERGDLGTVFLDLYRRPGKHATNAHYTLLCGKRISLHEYRRPVVALACSFSSARAQLSLNEVQTLFHEFGHALNSVMCDNELQHMFGARGPLDAVELPSHILEAAVVHGDVLEWLLVASHSGLSAPARDRLKQTLLLQEDYCSSALRMQSLALPRMDACLHSAQPPAAAAALQAQYLEHVNSVLPLPAPAGTFPHFSMTHAITYGGLCHSYQYAETMAARIWRERLSERFAEPGAGKEVADLLIRPGGAVDANAALQRLLS
eukprot:jgi/Ulvmu1/9090/UM005_0185.1